MGIFYFLWFLITISIYAVYKHVDSDRSVDLQYFLNTSYPEELPTT